MLAQLTHFFFLTQWWCEGCCRARRQKKKGRGRFCRCRPSEALGGTRQLSLWDERDAQGGWALDMSRLRIKPFKIRRRSWLRKIWKGGRRRLSFYTCKEVLESRQVPRNPQSSLMPSCVLNCTSGPGWKALLRTGVRTSNRQERTTAIFLSCRF